ncbi:MAG: O-antigen ligase family protein [Bacteroidia bacterium]|nr:O-antigen ligase family protein [Bacteroidia bacterium]
MFFPAGAHRFFYLFGVVSLGFGIMLGAVPTSVPQFILLINWLLEGGFTEKWRRLRFNKVFWALEVVFAIHLLGLVYTSDLDSGLKDLQIKLPLLILPLVLFSSNPLSKKEIVLVLQAFLLGCLVNTAWCLLYSFGLHENEIGRNTSRFMSHIRLGLYLNLGILVCSRLFFDEHSKSIRWLYPALAVYFVLVIFLLGLATGVVILSLLFIMACIYAISRLKLVLKSVILLLAIVAVYSGFLFVKGVYEQQLVPRKVPNNRVMEHSAAGNTYIHFDTAGQRENGHYIHINIQIDELQRTWKLRCPEDSFSQKTMYNMKRYEALIRYMAGLGLNKDSVGVMALSEEDINNIRHNVPNHEFNDWSFMHQRVYELVNEYDDFKAERNINGNSVTMRYYFWKAALYSIRNNLWFGAGTGDVQSQMEKSYLSSASPLHKEWHKRPHNQFLTITVALGLIGLMAFLYGLFYPPFKLKRRLSNVYFGFMLVYFVSFLAEDTVETQAGVTFFAFFNTFLLAEAYFKRSQNPEH